MHRNCTMSSKDFVKTATSREMELLQPRVPRIIDLRNRSDRRDFSIATSRTIDAEKSTDEGSKGVVTIRTVEIVIAISRWWSSVPISISISIGSSRFGGRSEPSYVELLPGVHRENLLHLLVEFRSRFRAMTVDLSTRKSIVSFMLPLTHRQPATWETFKA